MQPALGWIDFSSEHRDRVRTVIDLLDAPGVVDELGIGIIRNAFSDFLFPGVSTIQTRPKYFLIVARILRDYEFSGRQRKRVSLREYLAAKEMACRVALASRYSGEGGLGIIGVSFGERTDRDVQRAPSSVYWNGLRTFGIVRTKLSLPEFCRRHSGYRPSLRLRLDETREEYGDDVDADDVDRSPINVQLPHDEKWQDDLAITLTKKEAQFLRQQICATCPESLLGQILLDPAATEEFVMLSDREDFTQLINLPMLQRLAVTRLRHVVYLADAFWQILRGAHVRYNFLLQERFGTPGKAARLEESWQEWMRQMRSFDWSRWDTGDVWDVVAEHGSRIQPWTERFVNEWIRAASRGELGMAVYDELVIHQEAANKRSRARLRPDNKDEAVGEWIGIQSLTYRLPQAWRLVMDIRRAETGEADPDVGL